MSQTRTRAKTLLDAAGLGDLAQKAMSSFHPLVKRDIADNTHLRVLLAGLLRPDSNAVDVGANKGEVSALICKLAPLGDHHAFEPLPEYARALDEISARLTVHSVALAATEGEAMFTRAVDADGFSKLGAAPNAGSRHEEFEVSVRTLSAELGEDYLPDFIKVDVEGYELEVLLGGAAVLERARPVLWVEHKRTPADQSGQSPTQSIWDFLCSDLGYRLYSADGQGPLSRAEVLPGVISGPMWNWLAVPTSSK